MERTANLDLPYIMPSQAQKHVTHNEAIRSLDALVQLAVLDRDLAGPPVSPVDGDRYLVASGAGGAWAGQDGKIAAWQDGAWAFLSPRAGWLAWVADEARLVCFGGAAWADAAVHSVNPAPFVGVNTVADASNRLAVRSPATLLDEEAGDHRLTINKAGAGDTASLVFQTGYSGRAEFGLAGDDDWHVKVSPDGVAWAEALKVDRANGRVTLPAGLALAEPNQVVAMRHVRERLGANRAYYVRTDGNDANSGLVNSAGGAFLTIQRALDVVAALDMSIHNVTIQVADGTYSEGVVVSGGWLGSGSVTLQGNVTTPANCVISRPSGNCTLVTNYGRLAILGFKVETGSPGLGVAAQNGGVLTIAGQMNFGACGTAHIYAERGGVVTAASSYTISGSSSCHVQALSDGYVFDVSNTITLTGGVAFSSGFVKCDRMALVEFSGNTYSGSASGPRYSVSSGGGINTFGAGATYFPGSSGGIASAPGWYA
ncbi:DUF2793 domain-containing protein [Mesorhizobium sp. ZMM04-5]|uniref:DUF2793 domain-containing protein n=1 Tax=Mesorhizobium marinum TaxID=3228790 RepID=A0ABV3R0N2_9HYPH